MTSEQKFTGFIGTIQKETVKVYTPLPFMRILEK